MQIDYITDWSGHHPSQVNGITVDGTLNVYGDVVFSRIAPGIFQYISPSSHVAIMALAMVINGKRVLISVPQPAGTFYTGLLSATQIIDRRVRKYTVLKQNVGSLDQSFEPQSTVIAEATTI